tara:strand:+ start:406 stop:723 length:318 start_codon:yes stop_codon:yes gene_type:complete
MEKINKKFEKLCKEIEWRLKETDYSDDDEMELIKCSCVQETIDKEVSYISISEVEALSNELGYSKMMELNKSYIEEYGAKIKVGDLQTRVLLYWYFEQRYYKEKQ